MKTTFISVACGVGTAAALAVIVEVANGRQRSVSAGALSGVGLVALPVAAGSHHFQETSQNQRRSSTDAASMGHSRRWF